MLMAFLHSHAQKFLGAGGLQYHEIPEAYLSKEYLWHGKDRLYLEKDASCEMVESLSPGDVYNILKGDIRWAMRMDDLFWVIAGKQQDSYWDGQARQQRCLFDGFNVCMYTAPFLVLARMLGKYGLKYDAIECLLEAHEASNVGQAELMSELAQQLHNQAVPTHPPMLTNRFFIEPLRIGMASEDQRYRAAIEEGLPILDGWRGETDRDAFEVRMMIMDGELEQDPDNVLLLVKRGEAGLLKAQIAAGQQTLDCLEGSEVYLERATQAICRRA